METLWDFYRLGVYPKHKTHNVHRLTMYTMRFGRGQDTLAYHLVRTWDPKLTLAHRILWRFVLAAVAQSEAGYHNYR